MQDMKKIEKINYYACGYCVNKLKYIIKNPKEKTKNFYAGVFLIKHEKYGYILFDTGYSEEIYRCGIKGKMYNLLNPTFITENQTIRKQLMDDNIDIDSIHYIILSHLHPDHIGGLKYFKNAKFVLSEDCLKEYKKGNFRSLIFKKLLPSDFEDKVCVIKNFDEKLKYFEGHDLFADGSVILTQVSGHFNGQIAAYIPEHNVFLGADICWSLEWRDKVDEMHVLARFIQNNFGEYKNSIDLINKLEMNHIKVYLSHDDYDKKELVE